MRIACIQMDMAFGHPAENYGLAERLIRQAAAEQEIDVAVLPELWNIGFFPKTGLMDLGDPEGEKTRALLGPLARELGIHIVGGSVGCLREGKLYNTAYIFNRQGDCIAQYDKTHLFSPTKEDQYFQPGDHLCRFQLDGVNCGMLICYDLRFPELARSLALQGMDVLFLSAQWPAKRTAHLRLLTAARAVENQMFVACCNSCGAGEHGGRFGGNSSIIDPWGRVLAQGDEGPCILYGDCDMSILADIREGINVFRDRRPEVYSL